ncbi:uncharacterized protein [Apostichopus japonicus]|uniref:uncharacterized protein isoform X2 n=1 Tax=Stichopus japonicus TaxID=307972 RepID=UPI003AB7ED6E
MKMKSLNASFETWFLLLIAFDTFIGVNMACQSTYQIEKGKNAMIGCSSADVPTEVFWYNGPPSSTNPILVLANDQKSGTLFDDIRFDINLEGKMLISNAQLEDEGKYTVVTYLSSENYHEEQFTIQITVRPQQECPQISGCSSCSTCGLRVNQTGELICRVSGSRPQISLQWEISNINSLQFTPKEVISQAGNVFGTWNTYISAEYTVSACGGFAEIRCLAQGDLMQRSDSNIKMKADPCPSDNVVADYSSTILPSALVTSRPFLIPPLSTLVIIVGIIVFVIISMILVCFCLWKRHHREKYSTPEGSIEELSHMNKKTSNDGMFEDNYLATTSKALNKKDKKLESLVSLLCEIYKHRLLLNLFPGKTVSLNIDTLYVDCQCSVRYMNNKCTQKTTTSKLMRNESLLKNKFVILKADLGYGKTACFLQMVNQWIQEKEKTFVLIYVYLNYKNYQKNLIELIMDDLASNCNLKAKDVYTILLKEPVIVLIDGFSELYLGDLCGNVSAYVRELLNRTFPRQKEISENRVHDENTFRKGHNEMQPLNGDESDICKAITTATKHMRVWVALRQTDGIFSKNCKSTTIELSEFQKEEIAELSKRINNYHLFCRGTDREKADILVRGKNPLVTQSLHSAEDSVGGESSHMLEKSNFNESWGFARVPNVPLYLSTLLYLDVDKSTEDVRPAGHWCLSNIVESIIECMERHYMSKLNVEKVDFCQVRKKIGKAMLSALDKKAPQSVKEWKQLPESDLKGALSTGLLHTNECSSKDASSSKNYCVSLRHPVLRGVFLGQCILDDASKFSKLFTQENLQNKDFLGALRYICGKKCDTNYKTKVLLKLKEADMWDDFIDCFYEVQSTEVKNTTISFLKAKEEINLKQVDGSYQERNVKDFFTFCKNKNYPRGMIIFESKVDISFIITLPIPEVHRVVIIGRELDGTAVLLLVKWIAKLLQVPLQFHDCVVDTFSGEIVRKLKQVTSRLPDKIQIDRSSGGSWKKFNNNETYNFDTGQWETTQQVQQYIYTAYPQC